VQTRAANEFLLAVITMLLKAFPDELVNQIVTEFHLSSVADKEFYASKQRLKTLGAGIHWTHDHLIPISIVNHQFRRVCLPTLYESVDIIAQSHTDEDIRQCHEDARQFSNLLSLRRHISLAIT
jgi:hypothetical protein